MDQHPIQGEQKDSQLFHATETRISSSSYQLVGSKASLFLLSLIKTDKFSLSHTQFAPLQARVYFESPNNLEGIEHIFAVCVVQEHFLQELAKKPVKLPCKSQTTQNSCTPKTKQLLNTIFPCTLTTSYFSSNTLERWYNTTHFF